MPLAYVGEAGDAGAGGNLRIIILGIDVKTDVAAALVQKFCRLNGPGIIIGIDAADIAVLPFDGDDGNAVGCQLDGRNRMAENNESLYFVGKELADVAAFRILMTASAEDDEFVPVFFIGVQEEVQKLCVKTQVKIRHDQPDEFRLTVGEYPGNLVAFVIQHVKRVPDLFPVIGSNRFGTIKKS